MPREYEGMPEPPLITGLRKKANNCYTNKLTDAEVDDVEALFKTCDAKSTGSVSVEEFKGMINKLIADECNMGKVPILDSEQSILDFIANINEAKEKEEEKDDKSVQWVNLVKHINDIEWKFVDPQEMQARVDKFYVEVNILCVLIIQC